MVKLDFSIAISLYLSLLLLLVFLQWIFYNFYRNEDVDYQTAYFQRCPYCTYIFYQYRQTGLKSCPRCHSFISDTENGDPDDKKN